MRLQLLHWFARLLDLHVKVDGVPYGARPAPTETVDCS